MIRRALSRGFARLAWWLAPKDDKPSPIHAAWNAWIAARRQSPRDKSWVVASEKGYHVERYPDLIIAFEDIPGVTGEFQAEVVKLATETKLPIVIADMSRKLKWVAVHALQRTQYKRMRGGRVDRWGKDVDVYEFRSSA